VDVMLRVARSLTGNHADAEDLVQDSLLRAYKAIGTFDGRHPRAWLLTIVRREHARLYERKRLETVPVEQLVGSESPELAVAEERDLMDVRRAILALEDGYREPLVLQVLMGYSTEEIAGQLGLTQGAVLTRLFRARQQLRRSLGLAGAGEAD